MEHSQDGKETMMAGHWTHRFSFVTGAIRSKSLAYVVLSDDSLEEQKIPLSGYVLWDNGDWLNCGEAILNGSGDRHEEVIRSGDLVPKDRGPLRGVRYIGHHVYVVGMGRQAWRRFSS